MTIETVIEAALATISVQGSIDSTTAEKLDEEASKLDFSTLEAICFDFKDVDYISSKCLRILVSIHRKMEGKPITIANANATVSDIIKLSGLSSLFVLK